MPQNDFFKNLDNMDNSIFRYLLYLSRNNRWVSVGDDIYQITIKHILKEANRYENDKLYQYEEHDPVHMNHSDEKEDKLKLFLSHRAISATTSSGGYRDRYCGEFSALVSPLKLNIDASFYHRLTVSYYEFVKEHPNLLESELIGICLFVENFDAVFTNKLDENKTVEESEQMIANYQHDKKLAHEEAKKNPIWLAAQSGDNELLVDLLEDETELDLNSTYKGKTILKAMLDATAENTPAFKYIISKYNNKIDYAATLDTLIQHGLDATNLQWFYNSCTSGAHDSSMYPKPVSDPNGLLPIIQSQLTNQNDQKNDLSSIDSNLVKP